MFRICSDEDFEFLGRFWILLSVEEGRGRRKLFFRGFRIGDCGAIAENENKHEGKCNAKQKRFDEHGEHILPRAARRIRKIIRWVRCDNYAESDYESSH